MDIKEFRENGHQLIDWMANFLENIEQFPVRSNISPGAIKQQLDKNPPQQEEPFSSIFKDFEEVIIPGITHWQHPAFHAYFPANSSYPSILAEMLTATLGAQCMIWETSPAAAELEEVMMEWLKQLMGIPACFHGVIQDTASTATLVSLLTAREKHTDFGVNQSGFEHAKFRVYCSTQTHSSIDKAVKIAGFGIDNLVKVSVDENFAIVPAKLEEAILADLQSGLIPLAIIGAVGTTSSTAVDSVKELGQIAQKFNLWFHVDAAYAGSASCLEELIWIIDGLEMADSYVFNPHKWLFTNFDCTAYYVKDKEALIRTFEIHPEYLKTGADSQVNNYRDWGIQLGRRFRALKLWFVLRSFGTDGVKNTIRNHLKITRYFQEKLEKQFEVELLAPVYFNLVCFRFLKENASEEELEVFNRGILEKVNSTGKAYITHTKLNGNYTIRVVFGNTNVEYRHADALLALFSQIITNG